MTTDKMADDGSVYGGELNVKGDDDPVKAREWYGDEGEVECNDDKVDGKASKFGVYGGE